MSSPSLSEKWVPVWPNQAPTLGGPPTPVAGHWLKAESGGMVWRDPVTDADDKWHYIGAAGEPSFLSGWRNYGGGFPVVGFRKLSDGSLAFKGLLGHDAWPTGGTHVFVLPPAYRPPFFFHILTMCADQAAVTRVDPDGGVLVSYRAAGYFTFDGVKTPPYPPFASPTDLQGLVVWLDASDSTSFQYSSGTLVSGWLDKSGTGFHFANGTPANQPSRSGVRNGLPTVVFDGNRYMVRAVPTPFSTAAATIFLVAGCTTHHDYDGFLAATVTVGNDYDQPNGFDLCVGDARPTNFLVDKGGGGSFINGATPTPFSVHTAVLGDPVGGSTPYRNGAVGTASASGASGIPPGLCLGTRWLSAAPHMSYGLKGEIAEIVIYDRILTPGDRQRVENYMQRKWIN